MKELKQLLEPVEDVTMDVPSEHAGARRRRRPCSPLVVHTPRGWLQHQAASSRS
jgi:hypothetical protein